MHPFARFIQILGKGKNGMRPLSQDEAFEAMRMITQYEVEPEQLGAFLMLMRVKEESAEEVAGFTQAIRESLPLQNLKYRPAIDWAAYAGKKRHLPWFLLSALVVAGKGYPIFMHGMSREDERIYVPEALQVLGIETAESFRQAQTMMEESGFAYLPIARLSKFTADLIDSRELFGLRPPLHTVARMLNPFSAPLSVMAVFHPNFAAIHQQAAVLLGQPDALICKGEGGEMERIPDRSVELYGVSDSESWNQNWDGLIKTGSVVKPEKLDLIHFRKVWQGEEEDTYGEAAVVGTLALVIKALGLETASDKAHELAGVWWQERHQSERNQVA